MQILDVYCTSCNENFTDETVWDAVEFENEILCTKCFEQMDQKGFVSYVNFYE